MQTIYIEPFYIERYEQVYALWQRSSGAWLSSADEHEHIARYLERNPGMSFLATADSKVVGTILGGHDGRRGYIHHLAVDDAYRRQGIGGQLVERCLAALEEAGMQKVHLFVFHENEDGIAFWEANGWELRRDILVMSKYIEDQAP